MGFQPVVGSNQEAEDLGGRAPVRYGRGGRGQEHHLLGEDGEAGCL